MTGNPTYVNNFAGEQLYVQVEDTPGSGTFALGLAVLINAERSLESTQEAKTSVIPRTDDPTKPGKTVRRVASTDTKITGAGTCDAVLALAFVQWQQSGQSRLCNIINNVAGGLAVSGPFHCTSFKITGQVHEDATCDITLEQANQPTFSANANQLAIPPS